MLASVPSPSGLLHVHHSRCIHRRRCTNCLSYSCNRPILVVLWPLKKWTQICLSLSFPSSILFLIHQYSKILLVSFVFPSSTPSLIHQYYKTCSSLYLLQSRFSFIKSSNPSLIAANLENKFVPFLEVKCSSLSFPCSILFLVHQYSKTLLVPLVFPSTVPSLIHQYNKTCSSLFFLQSCFSFIKSSNSTLIAAKGENT